MKIAFIGPAYPLRGGIAQFITLMAQELAAAHEVRIFSFRKQYPALIFPGKEQTDPGEQPPDLAIEAPFVPYNPLTWMQAVRAVCHYKPDVVILKYWIPFFAPAFGWIIRRLKKRISCRVVYVIDNIQFHEKWPLADRLTRYALGRADRLVTLSHSVYQDAKRLFPRSDVVQGVHPVYNCYNLDAHSPQSARDALHLAGKKVVLFFGYIKHYKGLDLLLKAFPAVRNALPDAHLLIVGEVYGDDAEYLSLIDELQLQDAVTFVRRFVANNEVELFFKAADVLALPYRSATQSGVVQIAYDMHLGAVATPVGGLPELIHPGKTGTLAASTEPAAIAEALVAFFALPRDAVQQAVAAEAQKYSWDALLQLVLG
jgi:glycosyltransferase involved in cell wall biosynthesis